MTSREDFDFQQHVYDILRQRTKSGFLPYHELYSYLGRRFCLKREETKALIKSMEGRGYLRIKKRGVILIAGKPSQEDAPNKGGEMNASSR